MGAFTSWFGQNVPQRREVSSTNEHKRYPVDIDNLQVVIQDYLKEFIEMKLNDNKLDYAPPLEVTLFPINRRRLVDNEDEERVHLSGIFNINVEEDEFDLGKAPMSQIRGNTVERDMEVSLSRYKASFQGSVVFERDQDEIIPLANTVQALQLRAFTDEEKIFIQRLQNSAPETGLDAVTSISASAISSNPQPTMGSDNRDEDAQSFDAIIVIAIAVAACSMILLGFALFLAFRRRQKQKAGHSKMSESPHYKSSNKTESINSPMSRQINSSPPLAEMQLELDQDDNISEYTESVYSLPLETKKAGVSSRFNPRYILSERIPTEEVSADSSEDIVDILGIPPPVMGEDTKLQEEEKETDPLTDKLETGISSRLYPEDVIDNDITTSLSAYDNNELSLQHENDDALSLSSAETYGFSLDGVGSTVAGATSTKYGY